MPASIVTNWGKASCLASYFENTDADANAVGGTFYIILIDNTWPGWAGTSNPDTANISAVTGAINPVAGGAGYTGNSVARGAFTLVVNDTNDRGELTFTSNPSITAGASPINNVRGYAICTANSISSGRVVVLQRLDATYNIGANQTAVISNAAIYAT